ncbi:unnamed protein product [Sphagnum tenellum]
MVPAATTSEGPKSEAKEEHRRNKQISLAAKLPAANPSELKGEAATYLSTLRHTSPALSTGFPLAVEGKGKGLCCELAAKNFFLDDPPLKWSIAEVAGISAGSLGIGEGDSTDDA